LFITIEVTSIYSEIKPLIRKLLFSLNSLNFNESNKALEKLKAKLVVAKEKQSADSERVLNELYVIDRLVDMLATYSEVWSKILKMEFSSSWHSLQDALDLLRLIKRLSDCRQRHNIDYFENQLLELEKLYPYNIFFSVGAIAEKFKCSICGKDINSFDCPHVKGELYQGQMAYAIAQNITELNHVSMVIHPRDKRCVVKYDNNGDQFKAVRFLSDLIRSHKMQLLHFGKLEFSKKTIKNPDFRKMSRNEPCYCGSGKKFKNCCITQEFIETDHVDIVAQPVKIDQIVAY
jgi:hypothetical protein